MSNEGQQPPWSDPDRSGEQESGTPPGHWGETPPSGQFGQPPPGQPPPPGQWGQPPAGQWGAPGYGYGGPPQPVESNLVWAILTTIFCCLPLGIVSIVYAAQVGSKQSAGDIAGAMDASKKARQWAIAAAAGGVLWGLFWFTVAFGGAFTRASFG